LAKDNTAVDAPKVATARPYYCDQLHGRSGISFAGQCGLLNRIVRLTSPFGAGSQFHSAPGLSFCMYKSERCAGIVFVLHPTADGEAIEAVGNLKALGVVQGD
jgi:hypothetical protein